MSSAVCLLQSYCFSTNNPYRDAPSAFSEAQDRARGGDLNAAVLLLEAAIQQDPQDSEVTLTVAAPTTGCSAEAGAGR